MHNANSINTECSWQLAALFCILNLHSVEQSGTREITELLGCECVVCCVLCMEYTRRKNRRKNLQNNSTIQVFIIIIALSMQSEAENREQRTENAAVLGSFKF
jgi:hypothetical protein